MDLSSRQVVQVTLVHGTWGRGLFNNRPFAGWTHEKSALVQGLRGALARHCPNAVVHVRTFVWSGSNSVFARSDAADRLAEELDPSHLNFVVGHSHGGNVGLLAIHRCRAPERCHLISIATPFVRVFAREGKFVGARYFLDTILIMIFGFTGLFVAIKFRSEFSNAVGTLIMLGLLMVGLGLARLTHKLLINPTVEGRPPTKFERKPEKLAAATAYSLESLKNRALIVRGVDDEASLALGLSAITNRMSWLLHRFGGPAFISLLMLIVCSHWMGVYYSTEALLVLGATFLIMFGMLYLVPLSRLAFGRELAIGAGRCTIAVESTPDSSGCDILTLSEYQPGLVHALHSHERCGPSIADWIAKRLTGKQFADRCVSDRTTTGGAPIAQAPFPFEPELTARLAAWAASIDAINELWLCGSCSLGESGRVCDYDFAIMLAPKDGENDWAFAGWVRQNETWASEISMIVSAHISLVPFRNDIDGDFDPRDGDVLVWAREPELGKPK